MYTNDRDAYRKTFFVVWQKYKKGLPLERIEQQLVNVILLHPEYHSLLESDSNNIPEFSLEENPFFHLSLHLALNDQICINKPENISQIYQTLLQKYQDVHDVQHKMITCLAQTLWNAQETNGIPNEIDYLNALKNL